MIAINDWLYIGAYRHTIDRNLLQARQIGAMLLLAAPVEHPGIESLYLPVEDGEPIPHHLLREGIDFVVAQQALDKRVLVACGAGISRSATFCVASLHEITGQSLLDAYHVVHDQHADALPNPYLWQSLLAFYGAEISLVEAMNQVMSVFREED